jgi:serine/threonine-protein kinase
MELALDNGTKATRLNDSLSSAYVTLGRIHDSAGKNDLALTEFEKALTLDPRNPDALAGEAHSYEHAGRIVDAEAAYKKGIALRPDYWDGYNGLGLFYDRQGRYEDAIQQFRRAAELTPDNAQVYSNLGSAYVDSGDFKKFPDAETVLKKSISLSPNYAAYANLGYMYALEQRFTESAASTEKALQINDRDYIVWANLAMAYDGQGDVAKFNAALDREAPLLEKAAQANPRDGAMQARLALLYAQKKVRDKALERVQTALALAPDDPDILENVGETYENLGDRTNAIHYIEKSLQKGYSLDSLKTDPSLKRLLSDPNFRPSPK